MNVSVNGQIRPAVRTEKEKKTLGAVFKSREVQHKRSTFDPLKKVLYVFMRIKETWPLSLFQSASWI